MHVGTGPLCIGVEAPWGKGKSTFLRLVQRQAAALAGSANSVDLLPVEFNAWVYDTAEQMWAGLAAEVINAVEGELTRRQRVGLRYVYAWQHRRGPFLQWVTASVAAVVVTSVGAVVGFRFERFSRTTRSLRRSPS